MKRISDALLSESLRARSIRFLVTTLTSFGLFRWSAWLRLHAVDSDVARHPEFSFWLHAAAAVVPGLMAAALTRKVAGRALKAFAITCLALHWYYAILIAPAMDGRFDCREAYWSPGIAATIGSLGLLGFPRESQERTWAHFGLVAMMIWWIGLIGSFPKYVEFIFTQRWFGTGRSTIRPSAIALLFLPLIGVVLTLAAQRRALEMGATDRECVE